MPHDDEVAAILYPRGNSQISQILTRGNDWPEPDLGMLTDRRLPAPPLPLEVFGGYWSGWISDQAEAKSCAADYVAIGLLAAAGVLLGNARWGSPWGGWAEPPIVWVAAVGNPSSGKSPGLDAARDVCSAIEADANIGRDAELREWDAARRVAKLRAELWEAECRAALKTGAAPPPKPCDAHEPERPPRRRVVTSDATTEKVARLLLENPKGILVFRDELAGWIGSLDKYGGAGSDRAFYLEGYGGRAYAVDRVKHDEPIVIPALSVGIAGGIQPDRLQSMILAGDDDGLAARLLYVWPERVPPRRPTRLPPSGAEAKLAALYALQADANGDRTIIPFAPAAAEALQLYREKAAEAESGASGLYLSWLGKLPGMAVRLATSLEHLRWCGDREGYPAPAEISETAAVAAIVLLDDYAVGMARRCLGDAAMPQDERDAIALGKWLMASEPLPEAINAREVQRHHAPIGREAARYDAAFAELENAGWLRQLPQRSGPGRKPKTYILNPALRRRAPA